MNKEIIKSLCVECYLLGLNNGFERDFQELFNDRWESYKKVLENE